MESDKTETVGIEYLLQSIVLTDFNNIFLMNKLEII